jgi:hypothetical protein
MEFDVLGSSANIRFHLNNTTNSAIFEVEDSGATKIFQVESNGVLRTHSNKTSNGDGVAVFVSDNTNGSGAGTTKCVIRSDGDIENINGTYGTISDMRLKKNILPARTNYLEDIKQLQVKTFNFIADENETKQIGFIAQDFEQVFPSLVKTNNDELSGVQDYKSIKTSVLIPILVSCIQEQQSLIEQMRSEIDVLNAFKTNVSRRLRIIEG